MANLISSQTDPADKHALVDECRAFRNNFHDPAVYKDPILCCIDLINRVNSVLNSNPDEEDTRIFSKVRAILLSVNNKLNEDGISEHFNSSGSSMIGRPNTDPIAPIVGEKSKEDDFPPLSVPSRTLQSGNTGTADKTALQSPGSQLPPGIRVLPSGDTGTAADPVLQPPGTQSPTGSQTPPGPTELPSGGIGTAADPALQSSDSQSAAQSQSSPQQFPCLRRFARLY